MGFPSIYKRDPLPAYIGDQILNFNRYSIRCSAFSLLGHPSRLRERYMFDGKLRVAAQTPTRCAV